MQCGLLLDRRALDAHALLGFPLREVLVEYLLRLLYTITTVKMYTQIEGALESAQVL